MYINSCTLRYSIHEFYIKNEANSNESHPKLVHKCIQQNFLLQCWATYKLQNMYNYLRHMRCSSGLKRK